MTPAAVILTVAVYIAVLFVVAYLSGRKADNAGFFTGNRRTPWYMAALAMIGAAISGVTFISVPGSVAADSFSYMQMVLGFTVGQMVVAFVLIPLFYKMKVVSLYEYLDDRFGVGSHRTGAWFFFISKSLGAALRVYVVCAVMQLLVFDHYGLPFWVNMAVTMFFVWLYTQQGGVKSLIWTDTLKTVCLVGSVVLCIVFIVRELGLTFPAALEAVRQSPYSQVFFFDDPRSAHYFWKMFWAGVFTLIAMTGLDQDMMQRNLSCASPRDSQKNIVLTALSQMVVIYLFLMLGVFLYLYMDANALSMPEKSDQVFSLVAVGGGLHPVRRGTDFEHLFGGGFGAHGAHHLLYGRYLGGYAPLRRTPADPRPPAGARGHGRAHGVVDPLFRGLRQRQRHQPRLQGGELHLWPDSGNVRLRHVHPLSGARPLGTVRGRCGAAAERIAAICGPRVVELPYRFRIVDLQRPVHHAGHVAAGS